MMRSVKSWFAPIVLLFILAVAAFLRVWGMGYGLPYPTARPDEERIVGRAHQIVASGSFHPGDYTYPGLAKYLNALALYLYVGFGRLFGRYDRLWDFLFDAAILRPGLQYWVCRSVSVVFGVATVLATYFLAREGYRRRAVGLVAASVVGTCLLHVRDSRFATVDVVMTFFITLSLVFAVRAARDREVADFVLAGLFAGLAAATKYNAGLVILGVYAAGFSAWLDSSREETGPTTTRPLYGMVLATLAMTVAFALTTPYSLINYRPVLNELQAIQNVLYGGTGTRAIWVHLRVTFPEGLGWTFFLTAVAGVLRAAWLRRPSDWVLLAFFVPAFAAAATVRWILPRYVIPFIPLLAVLAAETALAILRRPGAVPALAAGLLLAGPGLVKSIDFDRVAARKDTRVLAAEWVAEHIPPRSEILLCRGYGAPAINSDRRRPPAFAPREIACAPEELGRTAGRYVITHEHPYLHTYSGVTERMRDFLEQNGRRRVVFNPFRKGRHPEPYFYPGDAFYLPISHLGAMERGGPILTIWELQSDIINESRGRR